MNREDIVCFYAVNLQIEIYREVENVNAAEDHHTASGLNTSVIWLGHFIILYR